MKLLKNLFMFLFAFFLVFISQSQAQETPLTEDVIKNFSYHLLYSDRTITLKNGKYESPLRPGNKEDMNNFVSV